MNNVTKPAKNNEPKYIMDRLLIELKAVLNILFTMDKPLCFTASEICATYIFFSSMEISSSTNRYSRILSIGALL